VILELESIDGSLLTLQNTGGFRKFIKQEADRLLIKGSIQRIPTRHAIVEAIGDDDQHNQFGAILNQSVNLGLISAFKVQKQESALLQYVPQQF
jgi:acylphosphatase